MATGRTLKRWTRFFMGGYDLSGYSHSFGPAGAEHETPGITALSDAVQGGLPDHAMISLGDFKGIFDNTATSSLHVLHSGNQGAAHIVTAAIGIRAAPAAGDPVFSGRFMLDNYKSVTADGMLAVEMKFGPWDAANLIAYDRPWGFLSHANGAETAVNGATGLDDNGASSALGGFGVLHVLDGNGTATVSIEHSAVNVDGNFDSTGDIIAFAEANGTSPSSQIVATATPTTTINRYTRWQISLNSASTMTFVVSLIRIV